MVSSYVIDDDDSDASNEMDMLMTTVDISLPATNAASAAASAAAAASPRMPSMPSAMPPPPPQQMFDMTTGQFHPDFMFCGECKDPSREPNSGNSGNDVYPEEENVLESYNSKPKSNKKSKSQQGILIRSKFHLSDPVTSASHILVIQSLLQPLPGVSKVMLAPPLLHNQVLVDHDAQTSTDSILQALASVGHPAVLQAPQASADHANEPIWVRSNFHVQGICCASEVPIVKKIIKPLPGVSRKIQINITTRTLYVQHDLNITTAPHIATRLTQEGFPATIQKDGAIAAAAQQQALHQGRTTLHVNGVLIDQDIAPIQQRLSQIIGVSRIGVNVSEAVIYVHHDVYIVSAASCVAALQPQYDCLVHLDAAQVFHQTADAAIQALDHIGRSKYVESTIRIDNFSAHQVRLVETTIRQNFIRSQVRAIYPHVQSQTLKVEHNPKLVSVLDVCHTLNSSSAIAIARSTTSSRNNNQEASCTCTVAVNGADLNLWLPLQEDYPHPNQQAAMDQQDNAMMQIHLNVWLSGIFWFVSILSLLGGMWKNLKYFGLLSVLFGLPPIVAKAARTIRRWQFDANCMMVTASLGALCLQEYDEAASVAFLFAMSEFLEARASRKARRALAAIVSLRPDHANVIHPLTKEIVVVPADKVPLGSLISVKTGDKIACDGVVVEGSSAVDESSLTGESKPSHKQVHDLVSGGTINIGTTQLVVRTTTTVEDSAVSRLIRLVEEAQSNRSPTEKMIDTFARSYTPAVVLLAALMCTIPWAWGNEVGRYWTLNGLIIIVIACPCALTISTPVTYAAGLAATAQRGIIVKGGAKLEAMGSVDKVIFDKTGTLTQGKFSVMHLQVVGHSKTRIEMLQLLALLQDRSSHPLSATLVQAAKKEGVSVPRNVTMEAHSILKGEGVTAKVDGKNVFVGNKRLFDRLGMFDNLEMKDKELVISWVASGGTVGFIGTDEHGIFGAFCVKDAVREDARNVIEAFRKAGIETIMCTGDSNAAAHAVAKEIGMPRGGVHSQLLPEDKLHFVGSLKRPEPKSFGMCRGKQYILFCGDGVNDAPALAVADIGVSMGEGAAMAMEMSDVTLMDSSLTKLSYAILMGRRVLATIKENILISLTAKSAVVVLTFAGKMTLLTAIAADVGIMLVVTLNGMKLLPGKVDPSSFNEITSLEKKTSLTQRESKYSKVEMRNVDLSTPADDEMTNIELSTPKGVDAEIV